MVLVIGSRDPAANPQGLHAGNEILTINSEPAINWAERNVGTTLLHPRYSWTNPFCHVPASSAATA